MSRSRFLHLVITAALAASFGLAADESLPKGFDLLDKFVEATGGKAAYEKHRTEVAKISIDFVGKGIKGSGMRYADNSNNTLETMTLEGVGKIDAGVSNGIAWETNPITGPRVLSGEEKAGRLRGSRFNAALYAREHFKTAETVGVESVDGEECYKVVLTPMEGKPETVYLSKSTGLEKKRSVTTSGPMGEIAIESIMSDYKSFDGVMGPTKVTQRMMGNEITVTADDVKYNVDLPKTQFDPPADIKKLLAK